METGINPAFFDFVVPAEHTHLRKQPIRYAFF